MTINVGTDVRGYIFRADGQHVYVAGTVIQIFTIPVQGFDVAMAVVERADTGDRAAVYLGQVEPIAPRAADTFNYELADGSTVEHAFPRLEPLAPIE